MTLGAHRLMASLRRHQRLSHSTGVIAGFVSAVSVLFGVVAAHFAPKGWYKLAVALHFTKNPLIVKLAPVIGGIAIALGTAAAMLTFVSWCLDREQNDLQIDVSDGKSDTSRAAPVAPVRRFGR